MRKLITLLAIFLAHQAIAQLPNGSTAPDFTVTDINGEEHNLYSYLNQGKTVFLEISQTWCGICWNYHNTEAFKNMYNQYGPPGLDQAMILFVENDPATTNENLFGIGSGTQGNWVEGTPYPIIETTDIDVYDGLGRPTIYGIYPDRILTVLNQPTLDEMIDFVQAFSPDTTATPDTIIEVTVASITEPSCNGFADGAIDIEVSGPGSSYSYSWNNGDTTQDLSNIPAAFYVCTITDNLGNELELSPIEIIQPDVLNVNILVTTPTTSVSNDGRAVADVTGGTQPYFYSWQNGETGPVIENIGEGIYSLQVTDQNGCSAADSTVITLPTCSVVLSVNIVPASCEESFDGEVNILVDGDIEPTTFEWSSGDTTQNIDELGPGAYEVNVIDANGCTASSSFLVPIEDRQRPNILARSVVQAYINNDGLAILTPDMVDLGSTDNCEIQGMQFTQDTFTCADKNSTLTVTYSVVDENLNVANAVVEVEVLDTAPAFYICSDIINVRSCNGLVNYQKPIIVDNCPLGARETLIGIGTGNFFPEGASEEMYTYTDSDGNVATCTTTVNVVGRVTANLTISDIRCPGEQNGAASINVENTNRQYDYIWSTGATTPAITSLTEGFYTVTAIDSAECSFTESFTIREPQPLFVLLDSITTVGQNLGQVYIQPIGGTMPYTYRWSRLTDGLLVATSQNPRLEFGDYRLEIIDGNQCSYNDFSVRVGLGTSIIDKSLSEQVILSPNPTNGVVQIELVDLAPFSGELIIISGIGERVFHNKWSFSERQTLDVSDLNNGLYKLLIYSDIGIIGKSLIIQH